MTNQTASRPVAWRLIGILLSLLTAVCTPLLAQDQPAVPKDSVRIYAENTFKTVSGKDRWGWMPVARLYIHGAVASGSRLWMEFAVPGDDLKFDCQMNQQYQGNTPIDEWHTACGGDTARGNHVVFFTGIVPFTVHLNNELQGGDSTLFTGKIKVGKVPTSSPNPEFYVDEDWRLPIAYVFLEEKGCKDCIGGMGADLHATMWFRGRFGRVEGHLFYKGKDVAQSQNCEYRQQSEEGNSSVAGLVWTGRECQFPVWNSKPAFSAEVKHILSENPGDYEIKVLADGHLARSLKFTVAADGSIVDNGIASSNKLGNDRSIVPVQVIGAQDGTWDKTAWKTGVFYGNPLTGFTAPQ
jgi:hypothetical protein